MGLSHKVRNFKSAPRVRLVSGNGIIPNMSELAPSGDAERTTPRSPNPWFWSVLGVAPFLLAYLFPVWKAPEFWVSTGFVQYDQPYYVATGRAIFERGNGLTGPNPYDTSPDAPSIYFHWITWLIGCAVMSTPFDPGEIYVGLGLVMALLFGRVTLALVDHCCDGRGPVVPVFLLAMWGGGVSLSAAVLGNVLNDRFVLTDLMRHEVQNGWWFPYWGRNLVMTTEATYHVLMALAWLMLFKRRWAICLLSIALIVTTHPYTGAQVLAIMSAWLGLNLLRPDWSGHDRVPWWFAIGLAGLGAAFGWYYFVFLHGFPEHVAIQERWNRGWAESPFQTLVAYLPVAVLAVVRLRQDRPWSRPETAFLVTAAIVSFGLAHHHWFIQPHQPIHFTRGYIWLPLALLAAPWLSETLRWAQENQRRLNLVCGLALLFCLDNIGWLWWTSRDVAAYVIPFDLHRFYREIDRKGLTGTVLANNQVLNYLTPTYTSCQTYLGHALLTPDHKQRSQQMEELMKKLADAKEAGRQLSREEIGPWFDQVDYLLRRRDRPIPVGWEPALQSRMYVLYQRSTATAATNSGARTSDLSFPAERTKPPPPISSKPSATDLEFD